MTAPVVVKPISLEEEYRKKTGVSPQDIKKLRAWLMTQPHLPSDLITDLDLILTYYCCQNSAEVAKQVLDLHFTLRTHLINFFKDRVVDEKVEKTVNVVLPLCVEKKAHDGSQIFYAHLLDYEAKNFNFTDAIRTTLMILDLIQLEQGTWPGAIVVVDMEGMTLAHLGRLELQVLQQFLFFVQEAVLWRLKGIHVLNAASFVDKLLMLIKPFVKKEFFNMIHIHQTGETTYEKYFSKDVLPNDVGGKAKSFEEYRVDIIERLRKNEDYFRAENKKRVTETLRPGRAKDINDIFGGVEGSFKKLDID